MQRLNSELLRVSRTMEQLSASSAVCQQYQPPVMR
jgi:hypothetical protein